MEERTLLFISDPGHAWLQVTLKDIVTLKVSDKISSCSYVKKNMAFLEEDCDAVVFLNAAKAAGWLITIRETYQDPTQIRNYRSYKKVW